MENKIKKIEKLLSDYFCDPENSKLLALDNLKMGSPIFYTGVGMVYIMKYIIKYKYRKNLVIYTLFNMLNDRRIGALYCSDVEKVVFENIKTDHWTYYVLDLPTEERTYGRPITDRMQKEFDIFCDIRKQLLTA
jgi:hypothetical protein